MTVERSTWKALCDRYFDVTAAGEYAPKVVRMILPNVEQGKVTQQPYDIPLFALVKHHSLGMDTLSVEFDVELRGLDATDSDELMAAMPRGLLSRHRNAKVCITFKGGDAHEGVMLLNDKILKSFPR